jgi:hypothetical protein
LSAGLLGNPVEEEFIPQTGIIETDNQGNFVRIIEKPKLTNILYIVGIQTNRLRLPLFFNNFLSKSIRQRINWQKNEQEAKELYRSDGVDE